MGFQEGQLTWTLVGFCIVADIFVWCGIGNRKGIRGSKLESPTRTMVRCMGVFVRCGGLPWFGKVVWIEGLHCIWYLKLGNGAVKSVKIFPAL